MAKRKIYSSMFGGKPAAASSKIQLPRVTSPKGMKLAKEAQSLWKSGDYEQASTLFLKAWEASPDDMRLLVYVTHILGELNAQVQAIALLEAAIARHGATEEICLIMAQMAIRMQLYDIAEKLFHTAISLNPQNESHYVNLTGVLKAQEKYDEAINLLQDILPIFPQSGKLWSNLAVIAHEQDGSGTFNFHLEAMKHGSQDYEVLNNYANTADAKPVEMEFADVGDSEAAFRAAIKIDASRPQAHVGLALILMARGDLKEAWQQYEYRLDPVQGQETVATYTHKCKRWKGSNLKGKKLLISAEQGIGDEVLYAMQFPALIDQGAKLYISCDPRLTTIYKRSFPGCEISGYKDMLTHGTRFRTFPAFEADGTGAAKLVDFEIPLASLPNYGWQNFDVLPDMSEGYLKACPSLKKEFQDRISTLNLTGKNIGLSWRSGKLTKGRRHSYLTLELLKPLFEIEGLNFFNLQYSCDQDEIEAFEKETGHKLHQFKDIDIKSDIEANLAIMDNMDLVIGPSTATQMFAVSLGLPTYYLTHGHPWWLFSKEAREVPWFSTKSRIFPKTTNDWDKPLEDLVAATQALFATV
ncbi:MAG: tetratricopeptide repeat protein [Kordiimonadaceae bacterium]|nr:tetratricopeptide repeat protein [Kordiimonadaceae bacterium]